ncbi:MAG: PilN domain-containing protein [Gemmatimonadota bacterium]
MARVNLIPQARQREMRRPLVALPLGRRGGELILGAIALVLLLGSAAAFAVERRSLSEARAAVVVAQADSARLQGAVEKVERIERAQTRMAERIELLESVIAGRLYWPRLMETLSRTLPAYVWLERVDRQEPGGERLRIAGASFANAAITDFMHGLEASPELRDVALVEVTRSLRDSLEVQQFTLLAAEEGRRIPEVVPDSTAVEGRPEIDPVERPEGGGDR